MKTKTIYTNEYIALIDCLTQERIRLGLLQKDIANILNLSQADISKIENFERRLDIYELKLLLKAYRIDKNQLLSEKICAFFEIFAKNK